MPEVSDNTFLYSTSAPYGQEFYDNWVKQYNFTKRLTIVSADNFEHSIQRWLTQNLTPYINPYEVKIKSKNFTCFNKIERLHRVRLLSDMYKNNLVYNNFYSFQGKDSNWLKSLVSVKTTFTDFDMSEVLNIIMEHQLDFPLTLNITDERSNPIDLRPDDLQYINESYFSIVNETYFYKDNNKYNGLCQATYYDTLFISEKTYKCYAYKHPFILLAFPHTLEYLKTTGYKSFHPFIDETYDTIEDDELRYQAVVKEICRLCKFTDEQWIEWQNNISPIVEHNYSILLNKKVFHKLDIAKLFGK